MYESELKTIVAASKNNALSFFVGAGVSALSNAPTWTDLINIICDKLGRERKEEYSSDEFVQIPQMFYYSLSEEDKSKYFSTISEAIRGDELKPNCIHHKMLELSPVSFITTNYDSLIEDAALERCNSYKVISRDDGVPTLFGDKFILKIHGDFKYKNFVLKEEDYLNYSNNFKMIETLTKSIFATNTVVFIGYSLNDYNIKLILNWTKTLLGSKFKRPFFIYSGQDQLSKEEELYLESKGLSVIDCNKLGRHDSFIEKYQSFFDALANVSELMKDGISEDDAFELLYQLLLPLDKLNALRVEDVSHKLSPYVRIRKDGVIDNHEKTLLFKKFFALHGMSDKEKSEKRKETIQKYSCILDVLRKARIAYVEEEKSINCFLKEPMPFADKNCLTFDYRAMIAITRKDYKTIEKNYQKAFYLSRIRHYDEALILFSRIAQEAFKNRDYLYYYLSATNCVELKAIIRTYKNNYGFYKELSLDSYPPNDNEAKNLFNGLPVEFRNKYDILSNLHDISMLYKYSYNAFQAGQKLQHSIETDTIEFGFSSVNDVLCEINNNLHFLLGNGMVSDLFLEYKSAVKNLMSLLVLKYATQNKKSLNPFPLSHTNNEGLSLDEVDFYCLITCFTWKEIDQLFHKHGLETIEFKNMGMIVQAIENIIDCYTSNYDMFKCNLDLLEYEKKIKNCLALLRYIDIPQVLVDKICSFILSHEFREIHIDDKVVFLDYQLYRRGKYSEATAKAVESSLVAYLDQHIEYLSNGKSFNLFSTSSSINYYNLIHYIKPKGERFLSRKLSRRIHIIVSSNLIDLFPLVTDHFFTYLSSYQKRKIVMIVKQKLKEGFSFELLTMLAMCVSRIDSSFYDQIKLYLRKRIDDIPNNGSNTRIVYPVKDRFDELNQVGLWCFYNILPSKEFSNFIGESALFDFYCLYAKFDYSRFDVSWLLFLHDQTLEKIAHNIKVRANIREVIRNELMKNNLIEFDCQRLRDILVRYFC